MSDQPRSVAGSGKTENHYFRFHFEHMHLSSMFGDNWFAQKAEAFARFFGTPTFLIGQTIFVALWIIINVAGVTHFDVYPFILLNLAFSLQSAYAAPLILLAQARQSDRDKVQADADARHREAIGEINEARMLATAAQTAQIAELLQQNTSLTELTNQLSTRIEMLTIELHKQFCERPGV